MNGAAFQTISLRMIELMQNGHDLRQAAAQANHEYALKLRRWGQYKEADLLDEIAERAVDPEAPKEIQIFQEFPSRSWPDGRCI